MNYEIIENITDFGIIPFCSLSNECIFRWFSRSESFFRSQCLWFEFFSTTEQTLIYTVAYTESNSSAVRVQFNAGSYDPNMNSLPFTYQDQWSKFLPWNLYVRTDPYPSAAVLLTLNAYFFIDGNSNAKYDNGEPFSSILSSIRPTGTYNLLNAAQNVQITGGIYPTITWDPVTDAENYRVGILGFDIYGNPNPVSYTHLTLPTILLV